MEHVWKHRRSFEAAIMFQHSHEAKIFMFFYHLKLKQTALESYLLELAGGKYGSIARRVRFLQPVVGCLRKTLTGLLTLSMAGCR